MEYRPIKRRLENGRYYWSLFREQNVADAADAVADAVTSFALAYGSEAAAAAAEGGGARRPEEVAALNWRAGRAPNKRSRGNRARVRAPRIRVRRDSAMPSVRRDSAMPSAALPDPHRLSSTPPPPLLVHSLPSPFLRLPPSLSTLTPPLLPSVPPLTLRPSLSAPALLQVVYYLILFARRLLDQHYRALARAAPQHQGLSM
jgi:hypothetical protein